MIDPVVSKALSRVQESVQRICSGSEMIVDSNHEQEIMQKVAEQMQKICPDSDVLSRGLCIGYSVRARRKNGRKECEVVLKTDAGYEDIQHTVRSIRMAKKWARTYVNCILANIAIRPVMPVEQIHISFTIAK